MKTTMLIVTMMLAASAQAKEQWNYFQSTKDPKIQIKLIDKGDTMTAQIYYAIDNMYIRVLREGNLEKTDTHNLFNLRQEEGNVCPQVSLELSEDGQLSGAKVQLQDNFGTNIHMAGCADIEGVYTRMDNIPRGAVPRR